MKWSQRISGLLFAVIIGIVIGVILYKTSSGSASISASDLAGNWSCVIEDTDMGASLLSKAGFSKDELDVIKNQNFSYVVIAEFDVEYRYTLAFDHDRTQEFTVTLFENAFNDLYAARDTLYPETAEMTKDKFLAFYAASKDATDFDSLFAQISNYEPSGIEVYDSGHFKLKSDEKISLGSSSANYTFSGNELTLEFSDVTMHLERVSE